MKKTSPHFISSIKAVTILTALIICAEVHARKEESLDSSVEVLEEVVVTGSRTERTMSKSPVKTELVKKETIERLHQNDLSQVLDNIPGITLQGLTGRLGRSAIIQGLGDDQILVVIDGVVQLQTSSSGYDLTQLSVNDIERVEVIKGGASSLYGSQAIGGVINIITKKPTGKTSVFLDVKNIEIPGEQTDSFEPVPNMINATLSGKVKDLFDYKLSFGHRRQEAVDLDTESIAQDTGRLRKYNFSTHLSKTVLKNHEFYLDYRFITEDNELMNSQAGSSGFIPLRNGSKTTTNNVTAGYNTTFNEIALKNYLNYSVVSDELNLADDVSTSYAENLKQADLSTIAAESQMDFSMWDNHMTTVGLVYRYQFLNQTNLTNSGSGASETIEVNDENIITIESYLQHNMAFNNLEVTPGIRLQTDSNFGPHAVPSVNLIYSPRIFDNFKTNIRSSVGTGYRIPSLKERFYILDHRSLGNYIVYGSEDLNPETSISYQLGFEFIKTQSFSFYVNGFLNNVTDMIGVVDSMDSSGNLIFQYENINEVFSRGVEISTTFTAFKDLELQQDITFSKTDSVDGGYEAPFRPRTIYKFRALYKPLARLDLIGLMRYQGDEYSNTANSEVSPSFTVFDLKMNYKYDSNFILYAGVDNVFDKTRTPAQDGMLMVADNRPAMGRQFYLGFSFTE